MLAQILPGFRDFRTPLVTGYLWLLSTWILLGKPIPSKGRKEGLLGMVNALSEYLSGAAVLAVLSFLAYLIGLLLAADFKVLTALVRRFGWTRFSTLAADGKTTSKFMRISEMNDHERLVGTDAGSTMQRLISEASARVEKREVDLEAIYGEYSIAAPQGEEDNKYWDQASGDPDRIDDVRRKGILLNLAPKLLSDMEAEIPILATKLQAENKDLYDSYSRDKSEAEFRLSVALPIAAASILTLVFGLAVNPVLNFFIGVAGLMTAVVLLRKGWIRSQEATSVIITALEIGTIKTTVLERLDELRGPQILTGIGDPVLR